MTEEKGHGSGKTSKASHEGKSNPRKLSAAQAELGRKGVRAK